MDIKTIVTIVVPARMFDHRYVAKYNMFLATTSVAVSRVVKISNAS